MKTKIFEISLSNEKQVESALESAAKAVSGGGVIVYPTESSYALGADATNARAVKKVFALKGRRGEKSLAIIVASLEMIEKYAVLNKQAKKLLKKFMPGPLTLVVGKKRGKLAPEISSSGIAFRIPGNKIATKICELAGKPITATSANESGAPSIYEAARVVREFAGEVWAMVCAGNLPKNAPSTIVDVRKNPPRLVRAGPIPFAKILVELGLNTRAK